MQGVSDIFDDLLARVDYVPSLAIKFCCKDGKMQTLTRILESFPNIAPDGSATRNAGENVTDQSSDTFNEIFESSQIYEKDIEDFESISSPIAIAILNQNKQIVKLILEEANYDLCGDISRSTGDSCIHIACKTSSDIQILESLLLKVRS